MAEAAAGKRGSALWHFLTRRKGRRTGLADVVTYAYLLVGVVVMFAPVVWLVLSSIKTPASLAEFPPTLLPYVAETAQVAGFDDRLPLFDVTMPDGSVKRLGQIRRVGTRAQMIDPADVDAGRVTVSIADAMPVRHVAISWQNYVDLVATSGSQIWTYIYNSLFVTIVATIVTVVMNSMAAFALSKYRFRGRGVALVAILATLMVPATVVLVPIFMLVAQIGLVGNLWGVILPAVATPTGVFLLRQYMLTIPDELIEAARMDHASEWRIFWRIVLPLASPAVAVVAIFSILSRWNDFLLPLIVLNRREVFTLQLALNSYQGENEINYASLLSLTTLTALPLALAFIFLQRYITTGIATTGIK